MEIYGEESTNQANHDKQQFRNRVIKSKSASRLTGLASRFGGYIR